MKTLPTDLEQLYTKWRGQMLKGLVEYLVLAYIRRHGKTHGYELLQVLRDDVPLTSDLADGPIYAILNRLHHQKMLDVEFSKVKGRRRKYFSITQFGQDFFSIVQKDMRQIIDLDVFIS